MPKNGKMLQKGFFSGKKLKNPESLNWHETSKPQSNHGRA
jgi:hypothetical protein